MRVLVVDDELTVRSVLRGALSRDGHVVLIAGDLESARRELEQGVDLLVLDLAFPDGSGIEFCRTLRAAGETLPILLLSGRVQLSASGEDEVALADDFLPKPFSLSELRARVRALGRKRAPSRDLRLQYEEAQVDFATRKASRSGARIPITAREWAILDFLASREGRVVSRAEILSSVWGADGEMKAASLEVLIARLRKKLGYKIIRTLRGEGYALSLASSSRPSA